MHPVRAGPAGYVRPGQRAAEPASNRLERGRTETGTETAGRGGFPAVKGARELPSLLSISCPRRPDEQHAPYSAALQARVAQRTAAFGGGARPGVLAGGDAVEDFAAVRAVDHLAGHPPRARVGLEQREAVPDPAGLLRVPGLRGGDFLLGPLHALEGVGHDREDPLGVVAERR